MNEDELINVPEETESFSEESLSDIEDLLYPGVTSNRIDFTDESQEEQFCSIGDEIDVPIDLEESDVVESETDNVIEDTEDYDDIGETDATDSENDPLCEPWTE